VFYFFNFAVTVIGFRPVTYTVQEGMQNVTLTIAVIQGSLQRAVGVAFFTADDTAVGKTLGTRRVAV